MTDPRVCCITPTRDRPEYLKRTVECYKAQTYHKKSWVVMNTGDQLQLSYLIDRPPVTLMNCGQWKAKSIGALRNEAIKESWSDLITHFDDDDWSAPSRLADQVAFMQGTGCECTGYYNMPFYDTVQDRVLWYDSKMGKNYALGTSLMYKRELWERCPFPDQTPEDTTWQFQHQKTVSQSSIRDGQIMMFQTLHGANAAAKASAAAFDPAPQEIEDQVRRIIEKAKAAV